MEGGSTDSPFVFSVGVVALSGLASPSVTGAELSLSGLLIAGCDVTTSPSPVVSPARGDPLRADLLAVGLHYESVGSSVSPSEVEASISIAPDAIAA